MGALYRKGKILRKRGAGSDAVLAMEQIVGLDAETNWTVKALLCIAKVRVKGKDFYAAYHTLNRLPPNLNNPKVEAFKQLVEAVTNIYTKP